MRKLLLAAGTLLPFALPSLGQVSPSPYIPSVYFNNSGQVCSGCSIFTYSSGTTTPLITYQDAAGTIPNSNPVITSAAGRATIFLTGAAYTLVLVDTHGNTIWSIDGITASNLSILDSNNTWTGTNTWQSTSTFNGPTNFNVGFTSLGPNTLGGGGSISGTWTGSPIFSGVPNFSSGFTATTGSFSGQITSTVADPTPPLIVASKGIVTNLDANFLEGNDWATPGTIGSTLPNSGVFTTLKANTSFILDGSTAQTSIQGSADAKLLSAGTFTGSAGTAVCKDANGGATTVGCATSGISQIQVAVVASPCTPPSGSSFDSCNSTLTWPSAFADNSYSTVCTAFGPNYNLGNPATNEANLIYVGSQTTTTSTIIIQNARGAASTPSEVLCIGAHQ